MKEEKNNSHKTHKVEHFFIKVFFVSIIAPIHILPIESI